MSVEPTAEPQEGDVSDFTPDTSDPRLLMAQAFETFMLVLLHFHPAKPADPAAWAALGRMDKVRRQLQRDAGKKPTRIIDPHGRATYFDDAEG